MSNTPDNQVDSGLGNVDSQLESENSARARRVAEMMESYLRNLSDAERDRMIQRHLAQALTVEQKARLVAGMMNFVIAQNQRRRNEAARGE